MPDQPTAFSATTRLLRAQLREAAVDHDAFETPLRPCDLSRCRATCCHDGAVLSPEEADQIQHLLDSQPKQFPNLAPDTALRKLSTTLKTATRAADLHEGAADFPSHFARTRCVFLNEEHKCTLQLHSVAEGHHPWYYKPISCWMHPVLLQPSDCPSQRPTLTLRTPDNDLARFASCTHCGRPDDEGLPAREVLQAELKMLSAIADRDFSAELNAPSSSPNRGTSE